MNDTKIMVEREKFVSKKNNKEYFSYFVKGNVRGTDVKVAITPPDLGGYKVLDIVFGDSNQCELIAVPFEIKDDKTGRVFSGANYFVRSFDENGELYECQIKPYRNSDKSLLNMLTR